MAEETVEHLAYNNMAEPDGSTLIDELPHSLFYEKRNNQQKKPHSSTPVLSQPIKYVLCDMCIEDEEEIVEH